MPLSGKEPIQWIEVDVDFCGLSFGVGACTATLSSSVSHKCFNTTATCVVRDKLSLGVLTLRFIQSRSGLPKTPGTTYFPCLKEFSMSSATVNPAGIDPNLYPLGKRGTITAECEDFAYHDLLTDKYRDQRISGAAQFDGIGYVPADHGTFFSRLRARWPYYAGRPIRGCSGYLENGTLTEIKRSHFIITDMEIRRDGTVVFEGKDVLDLADSSRSLAPKDLGGTLDADISTGSMSFTLSPAGVGNLRYPASGRLSIGSEIMAFTRSGDNITITQRGVRDTAISSHSAGDAVQVTFSKSLARIDDTIADLLINYANINPAFIPMAKWEAEITRWAPTILLSVDIPKPEGVAKLIGELAILGVAIWWDDVNQEIGLRMNRPADFQIVRVFSERDQLLAFESKDQDEQRLTTVQFFSVMVDPTKSATDSSNYRRQRYIFDGPAQTPEEYGDSRVLQVHCRWLEHGDNNAVDILGNRFLRRFRDAPIRYTLEIDASDDVELAEVIELETTSGTSQTGRPALQLVQVLGRDIIESGHRLKIIAQRFQYGDKYAYITENTRPTYLASSTAQRNRGAYIAGNDGLMSNGDPGYKIS